jgi:hypothetical protein
MYSLHLARPHPNITFFPTFSPFYPPSLYLPPSSFLSPLSFPPIPSLLNLFLPPPLSPSLPLSVPKSASGSSQEGYNAARGIMVRRPGRRGPFTGTMEGTARCSAVRCSAVQWTHSPPLYLDLFLPTLHSTITSYLSLFPLLPSSFHLPLYLL